MKSNRIEILAARNRAEADAAALRLWNERVRGLAEGRSLAELAAELNRKGVPTPRGGRWHKTSVARLVARVRAAEALTYHEAQLLKTAVQARMSALRDRSSGHPGLGPLSRIANELPDEPPAGSSITARLSPSPTVTREDRPYLRVAAGLFIDEILRQAHDDFRRRYYGAERCDRALEREHTRVAYEEARVLAAAVSKLSPDNPMDAPDVHSFSG